MGTETQRLQEQIKVLLKQLDWSQKRLARELQAMDEDDLSTEKEIGQFEERMKKNLTRPSVAPELLRRYLLQLQQHPDFAKLDVVIPRLVLIDDVDPAFLAGMQAISAMLDSE